MSARYVFKAIPVFWRCEKSLEYSLMTKIIVGGDDADADMYINII